MTPCQQLWLWVRRCWYFVLSRCGGRFSTHYNECHGRLMKYGHISPILADSLNALNPWIVTPLYLPKPNWKVFRYNRTKGKKEKARLLRQDGVNGLCLGMVAAFISAYVKQLKRLP